MTNKSTKRLSQKERNKRTNAIIKLRKEGCSNKDIANKLGVSVSIVGQTAHELIKKGLLEPRSSGRPSLSSGDRQKREEQIIRLREDGYSNEAIAETLRLSYAIVTYTASKLIREGRLNPQSLGRPPISDEDRLKREKQIIRLREEGHSNKAVAEELGLSYMTVANTAHKLIGEGRLKRLRGGCKIGTAFWYNLEDERVKTIIHMVKERATLAEMAHALGCTGEWVRQVINWMKGEHGEAIFASDDVIWTPQEAADELGVSYNIIMRLCRSGEIPTRHRGIRIESHLITEEGMRLLRAHPRITREYKCVVCGDTFVCESDSRRRRVCLNSRCLEEYPRRRRAECLAREPTLDSLEGWHKDLWLRLQSHKPPKKEKWLILSEACLATGLSRMQVGWLGLRHIVSVHYDRSRVHQITGKPMALYAASEMEIVRKLYAASKKGQK